MKEAEEFAKVLSKGITVEEGMADEIERIMCDHAAEVSPAFKKAFRNVIRHHRAHSTMMRAQLGGLVDRYNLKPVP